MGRRATASKPSLRHPAGATDSGRHSRRCLREFLSLRRRAGRRPLISFKFRVEFPEWIGIFAPMHQLALLMMGCFLGVIGVAVVFAWLIRQHNREQRSMRRTNRGLDQLSLVASSRQRVLPYPLPSRWMAIRSSNTALLRDILGLRHPVPWSEALGRARERTLFLSQPVNGWTLLVGGAIPDPVQDVDAVFRCLQKVSAEIGEVQFYSADRVLNFHGWARFRNGRAVRAYACAGEVLWNEGWVSLEERLLGMRCRGYGDELPTLRYGETPADQTNTERVPLLARRWSVDFAMASELLLAQEGIESGGDDDATEEGNV